ncbi:MAG: nucleotidyltransferase family protein [Alphaproteobacteria bacterium]|nr:nucleotidyltransferase family protein [Alphaproteobacteria bacterium]
MRYICGILLAAGQSKRMGKANKLLMPADNSNQPMIRRIANTMLASGLDEVMVILGHDANLIAAALSDMPLDLHEYSDYAEGMSGSIRHGLSHINARTTDVMIMLGDMPNITVPLVNDLIRHHKRLTQPDEAITLPIIAEPVIADRTAHPVIWGQRFFPMLEQITGDKGGRDIIKTHPEAINPLAINDSRCFLDVDTPDDLKNIVDNRTWKTVIK